MHSSYEEEYMVRVTNTRSKDLGRRAQQELADLVDFSSLKGLTKVHTYSGSISTPCVDVTVGKRKRCWGKQTSKMYDHVILNGKLHFVFYFSSYYTCTEEKN